MPKVTKPAPKDDGAEQLLSESEELRQQYEGELMLSKDALDDALETQPDWFHRVADQYALAVSRRDEAKNIIEEISAELDGKTRDDLTQEIDGKTKKPTNDEVRAAIAIHPSVIQASELFASWKLLSDRWQALMEAFRQRSMAISKLCDLYSANYFTVATGAKARSETVEKRAEEGRQAMAEARSRRRG